MDRSFTGRAKPTDGRDPDICVITCALTGVLANRRQCEGIPYTPAEIADEAKRAYDAGASVVHIHARNVSPGTLYQSAPMQSPAWYRNRNK